MKILSNKITLAVITMALLAAMAVFFLNTYGRYSSSVSSNETSVGVADWTVAISGAVAESADLSLTGTYGDYVANGKFGPGDTLVTGDIKLNPTGNDTALQYALVLEGLKDLAGRGAKIYISDVADADGNGGEDTSYTEATFETTPNDDLIVKVGEIALPGDGTKTSMTVAQSRQLNIKIELLEGSENAYDGLGTQTISASVYAQQQIANDTDTDWKTAVLAK